MLIMLNQAHITVLPIFATKFTLAQAGSLDEAKFSPSGEGAPYWNGKKLLDRPNFFLCHKVTEGQPGAGSFYRQFQHNESSLIGYMEDTKFPAFDQIAVSWAKSDKDLEIAIPVAGEMLLEGIKSEGIVWERLSSVGDV